MKHTLLISLIFLVSCAPARATAFPPVSTATVVPSIEPTSAIQAFPGIMVTSVPATSTPPPTVASTNTPIPCDPFTAEFCVTDWNFLLQRPVRPPANDSVDRTYPYASTANGTRDPHHGVEFQGRFGTPVHAAADGVVVFAGSDEVAVYSPWQNYYGNVVVLRHENDLFTLYAHLSAVDVVQGGSVKAGDKIGEIGQTGVATGSHLHFEVRQGNNVEDYFSTQNPELWLFPKTDDDGMPFGALALSVMDENFNFQFTEFTAGYHPDPAQPPARVYYASTYVREMALGKENAVVGDLPAGSYRIALTYNGHFYERWVEVQSGKLTQVVMVVE
jgi:hypothetical protein